MGTQYASTLTYHQQTHHSGWQFGVINRKCCTYNSQKMAASCKSMAQCTLFQRVQCELFHWKQLWNSGYVRIHSAQ